jgi:hypothetical protein
MELPEILAELRAGNRPKSRTYNRLAEGHYLTDLQRNVTRIAYRLLQLAIYGAILYTLIRILI